MKVIKQTIVHAKLAPRNDVRVKIIKMDDIYVVTSVMNEHDELFSADFSSLEEAEAHYTLIVSGLERIRKECYGE